MVQFRLRSRIIAFVLSLLKNIERIDNSVTDRYSLIADLCGHAVFNRNLFHWNENFFVI